MISNKNLVAYVNGKYILLNKASISILDLGFTNSEMIYDTFRTFNKVPYFLNEHLKRLTFSSKYSGIKKNKRNYQNIIKKKFKIFKKK